MTLTPDLLGRPLRDLRISLTDRCNFRCTYCMPKAMFGRNYPYIPDEDILTFDEIIRIVEATALLGVKKIRLTGGEPLLRNNLEELIERIAGIHGIEDIALTTNGSRLTRQRALQLRDAGLTRVTISLDAIQDDVFKRMNDVGFTSSKVLQAMDNATMAGFKPCKVNMVVIRSMNESQILPMLETFRGTPHVLRLIEYMDVGETNGWRLDDVVPAADILKLIQAKWPLVELPRLYSGEVAKRYHYVDGSGEIGIIASVTEPFCGGCGRLRLSSDGQLYTCLFGHSGYDIRRIVRSGQSSVHADALSETILQLWRQRNDNYSELRTVATNRRQRVEMSRIGG